MILYHALGKRIVVWFPMRIDFIKGCQVGDVIVGDIAAAAAAGDIFVIAAILLLQLLLLLSAPSSEVEDPTERNEDDDKVELVRC